MLATPSCCSALRVVPLALVLFASACAINDPTAGLITMTAQEIATAGNIPTCNSPNDEVHCHGRVISDSSGCPRPNPGPAGFSPSQLRSAYKITGTGSSSTTVAVVEAYGYPGAEADLAVYRAQFGLPSCTTANGCFKKVNQAGSTSSFPGANLGWALETALDLDMISAICRNCKLLLVEANSASFDDITAAVGVAASLGAHVVNNSYGGDEFAGDSYENYYNYPNIALVASTGDVGFGQGIQFPSASDYLTAVGGTTLTASATTRGWTETAWTNSVSGCSLFFPKPAWQHDTGCTGRTVADVAAVADPNTGVAVYGPMSDTASAWLVLGGTSVAAPIISGVYGVNGGVTHTSSDPYAHLSSLFDVKSGVTGFCDPLYLCNAGVGYDGPTGLGTPNGTGAF
jgi:subtilase family serine protease